MDYWSTFYKQSHILSPSNFCGFVLDLMADDEDLNVLDAGFAAMTRHPLTLSILVLLFIQLLTSNRLNSFNQLRDLKLV